MIKAPLETGLLIGYASSLQPLFVSRTWLASSLFLLELAWAAEYYRWYSSKNPLYFNYLQSLLQLDFVASTFTYLVCSS